MVIVLICDVNFLIKYISLKIIYLLKNIFFFTDSLIKNFFKILLSELRKFDLLLICKNFIILAILNMPIFHVWKFYVLLNNHL